MQKTKRSNLQLRWRSHFVSKFPKHLIFNGKIGSGSFLPGQLKRKALLSVYVYMPTLMRQKCTHTAVSSSQLAAEAAVVYPVATVNVVATVYSVAVVAAVDSVATQQRDLKPVAAGRNCSHAGRRSCLLLLYMEQVCVPKLKT